MNKKLIRKMLTASGGPLFPWQLNTEWVNDWKFRTTPASRSRVLSGKGVETDKQYTERRKKETTKRTWRSDAADIAHGIGEGVLALHPYTAIPYFGAKVGLDFLNGNVGWQTALNASIPLFHLAPAPASVGTVVDNTLEDAANAGSKTARNLRVAREIKLATKNKPNIEISNPTEYNISDNITLYRANPTNIRNLSYKGERYGDTSGLYVGKWFTDESSKPNLYASNMAKRGEEPAYYLVTVPKYWAKKQKASYKISNPNIEYEPEDYIIEDGINGLQGLLYQGRPGTIQYLLLSFLTPIIKEPSTSLKFFERRPAKLDWSEKVGLPKEVRNRKVPQYTLENARLEALLFAKKWGYELPENASLLLIEELYNLHNTFFRGVTTEQLENTRNRIAKELGINPELLTNDLYLLYVSTHPWPGNDRIWVTPFSHYGKIYGNSDMIGGKGLLSAVMRPWKTTKDIKQWPKLSLWTLGFKEDVSNSVITPWVSNAPDAIRSLGALSEFLVKSPLIYRGLGKDFKGTFLSYLKYNDNQGKLGWIESLVGELPLEIIIEKQGGKMNILEFLKNGSGIHIKEKNKGKFTSYCGGKVTDECILKGKNSSNPAIRKRATFAANARKWKHKKGGKAFVSGVSILDSNPGAYKEVKKRLKKHLKGGKTSTWLKIGNFLNNDTGKGVIGLGTQLFGTISGTKKAADFSSDYDEATKANVKAMTELLRAKNKKEAGILAAQFISYLLLQNPDNHYGELDLLQITLKIADSLYDPQEIIDYLNLRNAEKLKYMLAIQGSAGNSINWLDSLGGIASSVLNSNSNTTSSVVLPKLTTNKYTPTTSLSNPVLGNNVLGYMPDWSFLLDPSRK